MNRVTDKDLQNIVDRINCMTDNPLAPYIKGEDGHLHAQVDNFHLSHAYGGVCLHRMCTDGGGMTDVLYCGHVPKRELQSLMWAFIKGMEFTKA